MFRKDVSNVKLNRREFRDRVLGCWTGKNIGGTFGAPFEGSREMNHAEFYTQELGGRPLPNDDLDLQLVWLAAVEKYGIYRVNERILSEYWLSLITGPWNEYGICRSNIAAGLLPPLSGSCNNEKWKWSNGAWIRSEIWAAIFPGSPDEAAAAAYCDACCDHAGEGIYAELFTASLESAAYVEHDIGALIEIGLARIPEDCRVAGAVRLACRCCNEKMPFAEAREAIVRDSADLGWFQAPANIAFVILGLLYGKGDFGRSIALAVNCGDDTDCTGGTAGAILGILYGRSRLPEKWAAPIGNSIQTCSIENSGRPLLLSVPRTLEELTDRVVYAAEKAAFENGAVPQFHGKETVLPEEYSGSLKQSPARERFLGRSPYELTYDLPFGSISVDFGQEPVIESGKPIVFTLRSTENCREISLLSLRFHLPEGWSASAGEVLLSQQKVWLIPLEVEIVPGKIDSAVTHLPVEIRRNDRFTPYLIYLPLQKKNAVAFGISLPEEYVAGKQFGDEKKRLSSILEYRKQLIEMESR